MARQSRSSRIQAFVDLVDKPVVLAGRDPEAYERALYYEAELRDWFRVYPGWHLERNREMIRLVRTPAHLAEGYGLRGLKEPRDYLLFTLVLHFAEMTAARGGVTAGVGSRFLISLLAEELATQVQNRYGAGVLDFGDLAHRRSLMRVMQMLERLGALQRFDGSAGEWADGSAAADGLYAFTEVVYQLFVSPVSEALSDLVTTAEHHPLVPPSRLDGDPEQRVWRSLLLGPVLLAGDDPEAYAMLVRKHAFFSRELYDVFEWRLDLRQGMARVMRETHAQDAGYVLLTAKLRSEYGPVLLLCNLLRLLVTESVIATDAEGGVRMTFSQFCSMVVQVRDENREQLAGGLSSCPPDELIERVLTLMRENGMLRGPDTERQDVYLTPLCALYRGAFAPPEGNPDEEVSGVEQLRLFVG